MQLSNSEKVMLTELKFDIEKCKKENKSYSEIVDYVLDKSIHNWLIYNKQIQNKVAWISLYLFAMNEKQKKDFVEINNLLNDINLGE